MVARNLAFGADRIPHPSLLMAGSRAVAAGPTTARTECVRARFETPLCEVTHARHGAQAALVLVSLQYCCSQVMQAMKDWSRSNGHLDI